MPKVTQLARQNWDWNPSHLLKAAEHQDGEALHPGLSAPTRPGPCSHSKASAPALGVMTHDTDWSKHQPGLFARLQPAMLPAGLLSPSPRESQPSAQALHGHQHMVSNHSLRKTFWGNKQSWNFQQRRGGHDWGSSENLDCHPALSVHLTQAGCGILSKPSLPGPLLPLLRALSACGSSNSTCF